MKAEGWIVAAVFCVTFHLSTAQAESRYNLPFIFYLSLLFYNYQIMILKKLVNFTIFQLKVVMAVVQREISG